MIRIFCIASLALAAVSAVSGHVIRHKRPPPGWEKDILQNYDHYHGRYLEWKCQDQHNTTFFDNCCHPLLKGESIDVLTKLGCKAPPEDECDDGESSVPPSSTLSSSSQPAYTTPPPETLPPSSSSPAPSIEKSQKNVPAPTEPTSTTVTTSTKETTSTPPPAQTPSSDNDFTGHATFYDQNGVAGACGTVHRDDDFIAAIDSTRYGNTGVQSPLCGKQVVITNTENGKTVKVTIADACPTCDSKDSIDLSHAAFDAIGPESQGVLPIKWHFA